MQFIKNLVNKSADQLISIEGKVIGLEHQKWNQINLIIITISIEKEQFKVYGFIQIQKLDLQIGFKYEFTKVQVGTMNNQFCGLLSTQSRIYCDRQDILEMEKYKSEIFDKHPKQSIEIEKSDRYITNPYVINLNDYLSQEEFQLEGTMLYKIKQKLHNLKISTLVGYIYKVNTDQKRILNLGIVDDVTHSPCEIDLQYNDQSQLANYKLGQKISFTNLQKQSRVIQNQFKGFIEDQQVVQFDIITMENQQINLLSLLRKLKTFSILPYSQLSDIKPYTIDRKLRKFKVDTVKIYSVLFQYTCTICKGSVKLQQNQVYQCESCLSFVDLKDCAWEILALVQIRVGTQMALLKLRDRLVFEFFEISPFYEQFLQNYSLTTENNALKQELTEDDEKLRYLYDAFYKSFACKEILGQAYCDFIKTAKTKEKWKQINKLKKQQLQTMNFDFECKFLDYQVWIEKNEYEKLIIFPNGAYEQVLRNNNSEKWYENRVLEPLICLECYGVQNVSINYYKYIASAIQ
ncbi:unnamed protein product [Paramecium octaurelia]|uniref:Uncharacterized protein n=1 Tax=Paramecium octaurelia TaxID=43137 RepID=A0A8S1UWD8_PAROT|nr:unnamed protein product [Paramecium octaurelia]